jgi:predicted transcriptional regulator
MMEENLVDAGFTKSEAQVYVCLLENGPLRAFDISKKIGMYRPYVYDNLSKLMSKGFCSNIVIEGKKHFKAAAPFTLREFLTHKMDKLDELIPKLEHLMLKTHDETQVEVYKGKYATKKAFIDILRILKQNPGMEHLGMGIEEELFIKFEPNFSRYFIRKLEKAKIKERMISYESEKYFAGGKTTEYRFIPDKYFNSTNILIDGDLVTILFWTEPRVVIKIRNRQMADSYKKQFEMMWKYGKQKNWRQTKHIR